MSRTMKIERARTYHLRTELSAGEAFSFSQARVGIRAAMLVEVVADDGRSGWGEAYGPPAPSRTEPLTCAGDIIEVPRRPGLGLEVDRSMLERYSIATGDVTR
jgi:L-alanine-DL-glutamate epimerase-like enolase superfamily enzyme